MTQRRFVRPSDEVAEAQGDSLGRRRDLSVVVPMFEEGLNAELLHRELTRAVRRISKDYEIIVVNDGSKDATLDRLRTLCASDPHLSVLSFERNYGQAAAIQAGFDHASGRIVITMDGDLQNNPADIARLVAKLEDGFDVVSGWRKTRQENFITRRLPSKVANWLITQVTGTALHDNGCTLKAYRLDVVKNARLYAEMHRFLVPMLSLSESVVTELEVDHRPRLHGRSKYGLSRIWKVLLDLVTVKMLLRFSSHPAAWFAILAFPFFVISLFALVGSAVSVDQVVPAGAPSIVLPSIALLAAFTSLHLLLLGMLAELVVRVGDRRESDALLMDIVRKGAGQA